MNLVDERLGRAAAELRATVVTMPLPRPRHERPARLVRAALAAAAGLVVGAAALPLLWLSGDAPPPLSPAAPSAAPAEFPRLLVDGSRLSGDLALRWAVDEAPSGQGIRPSHLVALGAPDGTPATARIWLETLPEGSDIFRGDAYRSPEWVPLEVPVGEAYSRPVRHGIEVAWDTGAGAAGPALFAYGYGVPSGVIVEVVRTLAPAGDGWSPAVMPEGFVELYAGPATRGGTRRVALGWDEPSRVAEVSLELDDGGVSTREYALFATLGRDGGLVASVAAAEVRGHPAVRIDGDGGPTTFAWMETPDVLARLHVVGFDDPQAVVAALIEAGPDAWQAALAVAAQDTTPDTTGFTILSSPEQLLDDLARELGLPAGWEFDEVRDQLPELTTVEAVVGAAATSTACRWGERWRATAGDERTEAARALIAVVEVASRYSALPEAVVEAAAAAAAGDEATVAAVTEAC